MRGMSKGLVLAFAGWALSVLVVGASGQQLGGSPDAKKMKNPVAATPESIAAGQKTFDKYCKFCHGARPRATVRWPRRTRTPRT